MDTFGEANELFIAEDYEGSIEVMDCIRVILLVPQCSNVLCRNIPTQLPNAPMNSFYMRIVLHLT